MKGQSNRSKALFHFSSGYVYNAHSMHGWVAEALSLQIQYLRPALRIIFQAPRSSFSLTEAPVPCTTPSKAAPTDLEVSECPT